MRFLALTLALFSVWKMAGDPVWVPIAGAAAFTAGFWWAEWLSQAKVRNGRNLPGPVRNG